MSILVFDTESDGFVDDATRLWCIAARDFDTHEEWFFGPDDIEEGLQLLQDADVIVAHGLLSHDLPLIYKLYPDFKCPLYEDSLILSRLYNPDRPAHSIEYWGDRFGVPKPEHSDWTQFSEDMQHRCIEDTRINCRVLRTLVSEADGYDWREAIALEYSMQIVQTIQEWRGFYFAKSRAERAHRRLFKLAEAIYDELDRVLPPQVKAGTHYKKPWTLAGKLNHHVANWLPPEQHENVIGPFTGVKFEQFNMNSPKQLNSFLLTQGWEPDDWNFKKRADGFGYETDKDGNYIVSSPKITESSLDSIEGDLGKKIAQYRVVQARRNNFYRVRKKDGKLGGWLNWIRDDGTVPGRGIPCGTNTGRWTHTVIMNVARPSTPGGYTMRSCFIARPPYLLAGVDAAGLEARMMAHFTRPYDDGAFATLLLEGDIHSCNAEQFTSITGQTVTREDSKTVFYACIYGARPRKLAQQLGVSIEIATKVYEGLWEANPGLKKLNDACISEAKSKGYITTLDGRKVYIRSPHSAMNALFQSAGSMVVKRAIQLGIIGDLDPVEYLRLGMAGELDYWQVLSQHDEIQVEVLPEQAEQFEEHILAAFLKAGESFDLSLPTPGDIKWGKNWAATH